MKELIEIQKRIHTPKGHKPGNNRYTYRKVDDIIRAVKALGIDNIFITLSDDLVELRGDVYTKGTATISNGETSVSASAYAKEGNLPGQSDPQISGSCSTYARKKALEGLLALDDGNDPDATPLPDNLPQAHQEQADASQRKTMNAYMKRFTESGDMKAIDYISEALADPNLTHEQAETIIKHAKAKIG